MFNLNDGYNLKPVPEPSIIEKLASLDIDIRKLRIKHSGTSSSCYSDSTALSYRGDPVGKKDGKSRHNTNNDFNSDLSKSHFASKHSIKSRHTEMSLEERILNGYYKVNEQ